MKKDIKIALVNPRIESYSSMISPMGLLWIAAVLEKNGFQVRIFDIYPRDDRDIRRLISYAPDVVGMTVLTDYWDRAKYIAEMIQKNLTDFVFVIGGVHVTVLPEESLNGLNAHVGVIGEGEQTMLELCSLLRDGADWEGIPGIVFKDAAGHVVRNTPREYIKNLDELPPPARHLLSFEDYLTPPGIIRGHWSERSTTVMASRGCPFDCIWCGSMCTFGKKVRYRSVESVLDEIESLVRDYSIDSVWFCDDTFTLNKSRVLDFCDKILNREINVRWGCQAHVTTADEEMFKAMKKAGLCQLDFGVESGSNRVLKMLKKNSDNIAIKRAFKIARKIGIRTMATFMFGCPGEEKEDVESTFALAKEIAPNFVSSFFLTPYPGTELMKMAEENNWITANERKTHGLKKGPMLEINFRAEELLDIRRKFQKAFIFRNFSSIILNPFYLFKMISLLFRYPYGLLIGIRVFMKTFVFDDLVFGFLDYYIEKKTAGSKSEKF